MTTKLTILGKFLNVNASGHQVLRHSSGFKYYQYLKEKQPYDIDCSPGGVPVIMPHEPPRTSFIESRDPSEWKAVQDILPPITVPKPPTHQYYPTPSGWFPPRESSITEAYTVRRTKFHNFPLFYRVLNGGNRRFTVVKRVMGDIRQFDMDLKAYLEGETGTKVYTMVNEVCCKVWIRGVQMELVQKFLTLKGF